MARRNLLNRIRGFGQDVQRQLEPSPEGVRPIDVARELPSESARAIAGTAKTPFRLIKTFQELPQLAKGEQTSEPTKIPLVGDIESFGAQAVREQDKFGGPVASGIRATSEGILGTALMGLMAQRAGLDKPLSEVKMPPVGMSVQDVSQDVSNTVKRHLDSAKQIVQFSDKGKFNDPAQLQTLIERTKTNLVDGLSAEGRGFEVVNSINQLNPVQFKSLDEFIRAVEQLI